MRKKQQNFHIIFQWYQSKKNRTLDFVFFLRRFKIFFTKNIISEKVRPSPVWLKNEILNKLMISFQQENETFNEINLNLLDDDLKREYFVETRHLFGAKREIFSWD